MRFSTTGSLLPRRLWLAFILVLLSGAACNDGPGVMARLFDASADPTVDPAVVNPNAPTAPAGLWATAISAYRVDLGWTDVASETGYKVFRRLGSNDWVLAANLPAGSVTYSCNGLKGGKNYSFKVQAYNSYGRATSVIARATTYPLLPISAPLSLSAWAAGITSINLSWSDGSNNEFGFKIERRIGAYGSWSQTATVGENVTAYTVSGLAPETVYYFRVRAYNAKGSSAFSPEAFSSTGNDLEPPSKVTVTAEVISSTRVDLSWNAATDNYQVGSYEVYRDETRLGATSGSVRTWSDGAVPSPAIDYCYLVSALDTVGNATDSDPVCTRTSGLSSAIPVSSAGNRAMGLASAANGANFLAAFIGDTVSSATEQALVLTTRGRKSGPVLKIAGTGGFPSAAWNGSHYLVMWPDDGGTEDVLTGQMVSAGGDAIGSPFAIAAGIKGRSLAAGGGKFLALYTVEDPAGSGRGKLWGRLISDSGSLGGPIAITGDTVDVDLSMQSASFNGFGFLVSYVAVQAADGWAENAVAGKFISLEGTSGAAVMIAADGDTTTGVVSAYAGGQHLVVWTDLVSAGNYDIFARLVSPLGNSGDVFAVTTATGSQIFPGVASDGSGFLTSWVDAAFDTDGDQICDAGELSCWNIKAQKVTVAGALSGLVIMVASEPGNQVGVPVFGSGRYFFLINNFGGLIGSAPSVLTGKFLIP